MYMLELIHRKTKKIEKNVHVGDYFMYDTSCIGLYIYSPRGICDWWVLEDVINFLLMLGWVSHNKMAL